MEPTPFPTEEIRRSRCRLCFHAGSNSQLTDVFTKTQDLSKRVISALGVKINRSEKQARICIVCETVIDIIQSFQAVCKQTNQLHHERKDFLLYETFWNSREQDAVKVTEKMILTHRSEVDKTISGTLTIPSPVKLELDRPQLFVPEVQKNVVETEETKDVVFIDQKVHDVKVELPAKIPLEMPKTEMVICEPLIKQELQDDGEVSQVQFQSELEEPVNSDAEEEVDDSDVDSDFRPDEADSASSDPEPEKDEKSVITKPKKGRRKLKQSGSSEDEEGDRVVDGSDEDKPKRIRRKRKQSVSMEDDGSDQVAEGSDEEKKPRRRGRKKKTNVDDDEDYDDVHEPKIPGKRGPRRKKVRKSDPSVCDICGQTVAHFVKESHHNQHLGVRPYKCDFEGCGRSYFSQNDLRTHSKRHQITYHVCEICGRNIKGVEWFRRHVKTHTEGPQFTCEVCGSKFRRKAQLQTHMVTHTGLTPHECEICGKRFALKYNLEAHVKRHQKKEDQEKSHEQKDASEKRTWKYYVKAENSGRKHHVTCETCGHQVHKREIEGHVNKHLGRRPYSCDVPGCTLAFYGLRGIKEHKMVVHSDKILRYECSICNRSIKGAGTFKRHVMMHNSDMKVECQYCGKKFTSKSYLKAHEQKHSGERPYVCEICGRSFAMKPCWKMHMKTVHNQDRREPMRVRKRGEDGEQESLEQQPEIPADGELLLQEQSSSTSLPLNPQVVDQQQQHQQQYHQQQQPALLAPTIVPGIPHYPTPDSVRTDYSY